MASQIRRNLDLNGPSFYTGQVADRINVPRIGIEELPKKSRDHAPALAGIAAIGSVLAASSCCLPVLPFAAAAAFAGFSAFLSAAQPYLLGASVLSIAWGFAQAARAKKCQRRPSKIGITVLTLSAALVAASILFPQAVANLAANLLHSSRP